jgi:hypothetical protein
MLAHRHVKYSTFSLCPAVGEGIPLVTVWVMRIELPTPSWADAHRAQEDAHTLTVPEQRTLPALDELLLVADANGATARVEIRAATPRTHTLTF